MINAWQISVYKLVIDIFSEEDDEVEENINAAVNLFCLINCANFWVLLSAYVAFLL